jgi:hypothetical protein
VLLVAACGDRSVAISKGDVCYTWGKAWPKGPAKRQVGTPAFPSGAGGRPAAFKGPQMHAALSGQCVCAVDLGEKLPTTAVHMYT